jgi:AraC family cel operon transcriptional repressor
MDTFLDIEPKITGSSGAVISFHNIVWDNDSPVSTLQADDNINYLSLPQPTQLHLHEQPEVVLLLSGSVKHLVNNEEQRLSGGSLLFLRPNDTHCFKHYKNRQCELLTFSFRLELLMSLSEYLEDDNFMWHFTESVTPPIFTVSSHDVEFISHELLLINRLPSSAMRRVRVKVILAKLFTNYFLDFETWRQRHAVPEWLIRLCHKMDDQQKLRQGLRALKKLAPCTQEHLCKMFRRHLHKSPTEFINELRMKHAKLMLQNPNSDIYEISCKLGIESLSRFYRLFKKHHGVPPVKYRKNHIKASSSETYSS